MVRDPKEEELIERFQQTTRELMAEIAREMIAVGRDNKIPDKIMATVSLGAAKMAVAELDPESFDRLQPFLEEYAKGEIDKLNLSLNQKSLELN